jgi:hypothetical protein
MKVLFSKEYSKNKFIVLHDKINFRVCDIVKMQMTERKDFKNCLQIINFL